MKARIIFNNVLVRLGIRKILPAEIVNQVEVHECGMEMVSTDSDSIIFGDVESKFARKMMMEKLLRAADSVRDQGLKFLVYELYRSPEKQARRREENRREIEKEHPEYSESQILFALDRVAARVGGSGHQTGGAVDLTLCREDGTPLDMGTPYLDHSKATATESKLITEEQRRNREILLTAMRDAGFVNYPAEWWHYCYGDKMWAAYSHEKYAIFGKVSSDRIHFLNEIWKD